jgi:subtilisin family serine protease
MSQRIQNADDWFLDLEEHVHSMLDRYKDDPSTSKPKRRVKIAILDTGVARDLKKGPASMRSPRVKLGKQLDTSLPWGEDVDGHGTHAAGLIHKVCPNADIFIYRVLESHQSLTDEKPLSREYVAQALADAVDKKKVDIVSMSLGWKEDSSEKLRDVIDHAKRNKVLLFAASSNDGVRGGMAYPARADEVIAIDAADGYGRPSRFNPLHDDKKTRFAVLGEAVKSEYPKDLDKSGSKRMSGTSCATPIAAGIAGLILEFARQRPMWCDPSIEAHLKTVGGMRQVFMKMSKRVDGFRCLDPTLLFRCRKNFEDGGEWSEDQSPRKIAAYKIQEALQEIFSSDLGEEMNTAIKIEQAKRVIEQAQRDAMGGS